MGSSASWGGTRGEIRPFFLEKCSPHLFGMYSKIQKLALGSRPGRLAGGTEG
jgi:hypothetical protein